MEINRWGEKLSCTQTTGTNMHLQEKQILFGLLGSFRCLYKSLEYGEVILDKSKFFFLI